LSRFYEVWFLFQNLQVQVSFNLCLDI
jgi:hypothetical protein